jgi:hypothetical protein
MPERAVQPGQIRPFYERSIDEWTACGAGKWHREQCQQNECPNGWPAKGEEFMHIFYTFQSV